LNFHLKKIIFFSSIQDIRRKSPNTIDGLIRQNYTLVSYAKEHQGDKIDDKILGKSKFFTNRKVFFLELESHEKNFYDFKFKHAKEFLRIKNFNNKKFFIVKRDSGDINSLYDHPCKFVQDNLYTFNTGFYLRQNDPIFKILKKVFQRLFEAGVLNYSYEMFSSAYQREMIEYTGEREEVKSLSLFDLRAGFIIWLVAVSICILIFIGEILHFQMFKFIEKQRKIIKLRKKPKKKHMRFAIKYKRFINHKIFYDMKQLYKRKKKKQNKNQ
jgi:hypothetical protein